MKWLAVLSGLVMAAVTLAGCSSGSDDLDQDSGSIDQAVDTEGFQLKSGKGAIAGLLVDDRFRPIHLVDREPETEFQAQGFVLLQQTGQRVKTDQNGQFAFVDLEPGTYTLRTTAAGHEAIPATVRVVEGVFNEISIIARRITSMNSLILTDEYSGFVTCAAVVPVVTATFNCNDGSGESYRSAAATNYTAISNVTYMIVESLLLGQPDGDWMLTVREDDDTSLGGRGYASRFYGIDDERYVKVILQRVNSTENETIYNEEYNTNSWPNDVKMNSISFYQGIIGGVGYDDIPGGIGTTACETQNDIGNQTGTPQLNCGFNTFGTGVTFAQRTQFIISVFVGEPEVDLEAYRLLTGSSS